MQWIHMQLFQTFQNWSLLLCSRNLTVALLMAVVWKLKHHMRSTIFLCSYLRWKTLSPQGRVNLVHPQNKKVGIFSLMLALKLSHPVKEQTNKQKKYLVFLLLSCSSANYCLGSNFSRLFHFMKLRGYWVSHKVGWDGDGILRWFRLMINFPCSFSHFSLN